MRRFGEYHPTTNPTGLGQHQRVVHRDGQYSEHFRLPGSEPGAGPQHYVVTTNHLEATWNILKQNIRSTKEFFDDDGDLTHHVDLYVDRYVYMRRR